MPMWSIHGLTLGRLTNVSNVIGGSRSCHFDSSGKWSRAKMYGGVKKYMPWNERPGGPPSISSSVVLPPHHVASIRYSVPSSRATFHLWLDESRSLRRAPTL